MTMLTQMTAVRPAATVSRCALAALAAPAIDRQDLAGDIGRHGRKVERRLADVLRVLPSASAAFCSMISACIAASTSAGHMTGPGAMPFTRTSGASSRASDLVSMIKAAFALL